MHRAATRVFCIILGLLAICLSMVAFTMDTGSYEMSETYGGDAYTGIQNAAAQTANNIMYLAEILRFGFGALLLMLGLMLFFGGFCIVGRKKAQKMNYPAYDDPMMGEPAQPARNVQEAAFK